MQVIKVFLDWELKRYGESKFLRSSLEAVHKISLRVTDFCFSRLHLQTITAVSVLQSERQVHPVQ